MKKKVYFYSLLMAIVMMAMSPQRMWAQNQVTLTYLNGTAGFSDSEGADKLIDGDTNTKWCSSWNEENPPYIIFKTSVPAKLTGYSMVHGGDTDTYQGRAWYGWTIYGANCNSDSEAIEGSTAWTEVDSRSGFYYGYDYSFSGLTCEKYQYYKLVVDAPVEYSSDGNQVFTQQMAEVNFTFIPCNHDGTFTDHPATEPTTDAHGCVAYKTCDLCGAALDADGNVIDVPVIHNFNDSHVCTVCGIWDPSFDSRLSALTLKGGVTATFTDEDSHPWVVTTEGESLNNYTLPATYVPGLRSNIVGVSNGTSTTTITLNSEKAFELSFKAYCDGEDRCDYMQIFVDGSTTYLCQLSSNTTSHTFNKTMTAGTHTFKLLYRKDVSVNRGYDSGIIYEFKASVPCDVHTWGEWTETKAATCTTAGSHEHTCSECGKTESEPLAALGHNVEEVSATAAGLCDNPGHSAYYECTLCHTTYADAAGTQPTLPNVLINGHAGTIEDGTCSVCGLTGDFAPLSDDGYYELSTAEDLRWFAAFADKSAYRTAYARLMNDIDAGCSESNQWVPIGKNVHYIGIFDGNGKKVSGLYFDGYANYVGFISYLGDDNYPGLGSVKDLTVDGYFKATDGGNIGGIVGYSCSCNITGCTNLATIIGNQHLGGIVGSVYANKNVFANVSDCHNHGTITGDGGNVGGIAGYVKYSNFSGCSNDASVTGRLSVGGIIGICQESGTIDNCHNTGTVEAQSSDENNLAGIVGKAEGSYQGTLPFTITSCSNTGIITGNGRLLGGLIGYAIYVTLTIRNSYNTGAITSSTTNDSPNIAGAIGKDEYCNSTMENVYSAATITLPNCSLQGAVGGFIGSLSSGYTAELRNCYYDNELTSLPFCKSLNGTINPSSVYGGKSTAEFASGEVAWLLNGSSDTDPAWYQAIGADAYPTLEQNPYTIVHYNSTEGYYNTPENFASFALTDATAYEALLKRTATELTYTRNFVGTNWTTWYVPFELVLTDEICQKLAFSRINNVHQYDDDENGIADRTVIESFRQKAGVTLKANYPYLVKALDEYDLSFSLTLSNVTLAPAKENSIDCQSVDYLYTFTGTYTSMGDSGLSSYSLFDDENSNNWLHFYSLEPQRHYMTITPRNGGNGAGPAHVKLRVVGDEDASGIVTIYSDEQQCNGTYDLMGRKLDSNSKQPGLRIVNGKKVLFK